MSLFGLDAQSALARMALSPDKPRVRTWREAALAGGLGFTVISAAVFATVAWGERALYSSVGKVGAYLVWTALFILGGGFALGRLVIGPGGLVRFHGFFAVSFLFYSAVWMTSYFVVRGIVGEILGTLAAGVLLGFLHLVACDVKKAGAGVVFAVLFGSTAGYFLGRVVWVAVPGPAGMVGWGIVYGLFLGLGLSLALHLSQSAVREALGIKTAPLPPTPPSPSAPAAAQTAEQKPT
jgi:hypothetical protein